MIISLLSISSSTFSIIKFWFILIWQLKKTIKSHTARAAVEVFQMPADSRLGSTACQTLESQLVALFHTPHVDWVRRLATRHCHCRRFVSFDSTGRLWTSQLLLLLLFLLLLLRIRRSKCCMASSKRWCWWAAVADIKRAKLDKLESTKRPRWAGVDARRVEAATAAAAVEWVSVECWPVRYG